MGEVKVFQRNGTDVVVVWDFDLIGISFCAGFTGFGIGDSRCPGTGLCPVAYLNLHIFGEDVLPVKERLKKPLNFVQCELSLIEGG